MVAYNGRSAAELVDIEIKAMRGSTTEVMKSVLQKSPQHDLRAAKRCTDFL